ncbi:MAG: T9SS type A sorting domain-containing protein [Ferruginibacter sp.]
MKKVIFTLLFISGTLLGFSQATYYWVGGTTGTWSTGTSWNTALDGSGTSRTAATTDVLIFDGTNIGGTSPAVGQVTPTITGGFTIAQLKLQNGADMVMQRSGSAGTLTCIINGDVAPSGGTDDLTVDATSKLTCTSSTSGLNFVLQLGTATSNIATGNIAGTVSTIDNNLATVRIGVQNANALTFQAGSVMNCFNQFTSSYAFGSSSQGVAGAVIFKAGSTLIYKGGNSPWSTTNTFQSMVFQPASTAAFEANASSVSGLFNSRTYANVIIRNNAVITLGDNFYNIDTLTVAAGATFNLRTTGTAPFSGNIINNGTFGGAAAFTTTHLIFDGIVPQSIGGTGTFNGFGAVSVATDANVTLNTNLAIGAAGSPTSTITGKLNVQNFTLGGTGAFQLRPAQTATAVPATLTTGSNSVVVNSSFYSGTVNTANVGVGELVTGTGIPANTYIIATASSSNTFTMSKPATATTLVDGASLTIANNAPSLTTSNAAGVDGSISTSGSKSFGSGANYVFNAATVAPFSISSTNATGDVTFNAAATTNKVTTIGGVLSLNSGKLTIRPVDTLRISITGNIAGTFNSSQYIATDVSGANVGVLRIDSFTTARTFPIGTPNYYMPVTLTPTTVSTFCTSLFQGITNDGTPTGTPFDASQKSGVVDAVWTLNRTTANTTDNCTVTINWDGALEGAAFPSYGNNIGVARHDGVSWTTVGGTGDNTLNTATNTFSSFSPFGIGQLNTILPVSLYNFSAKADQGKVKLQWNISEEGSTASYLVEHSSNGVSFSTVSTIAANGGSVYAAVDANPYAGTSYYRIKVISKTGSYEYSSIIKVKLNDSKPGLSVFPNPVENKMLNLQMDNFAAGKVQLKLYNNNGQLILDQNIQYNGGSQVQQVQLPATATKGVYRLVVNTNSETIKQTVIVQ